jgi:hypothetical protein
MRHLRTSEAVAVLNLSSNTLGAGERCNGFSHPERSRGKRRLFRYGEVVALRDAMQERAVDLLSGFPHLPGLLGPLAKTSTGKVQKFVLREPEWAGPRCCIN